MLKMGSTLRPSRQKMAKNSDLNHLSQEPIETFVNSDISVVNPRTSEIGSARRASERQKVAPIGTPQIKVTETKQQASRNDRVKQHFFTIDHALQGQLKSQLLEKEIKQKVNELVQNLQIRKFD